MADNTVEVPVTMDDFEKASEAYFHSNPDPPVNPDKPPDAKAPDNKPPDTSLQTKPDDKTKSLADTSDKSKQPDKQPVQGDNKEQEEIIAEVTRDVKKGQKDYTDIPDEDKPFFSRMSQTAFEKLKPVYLEHKRQKAELEENARQIAKLKENAFPESYYSHPRGYTLSKEFETTANVYQKAQAIVNHWKSQLDRLNSGDHDDYQEVHIDGQGNLYYSKPVKASKESLAEIDSYIKHSEAQLMRVGGSLQSLATNHENKYKEAVKSLDDFENTAFKSFTGDNATKVKPILDDTISKIFAPAFQNHPLARGYAKALLTIQQLGAIIKDLEGKVKQGVNGVENKINGDKTISEDQKKAGPANSNMSGGSGDNKNGEDVDIKDYKEYLPSGRL